mgnify:CR=1 FL=1
MKHRFLKALTLTVLLATASVTVPAVANAAEQTPSVINVTGYAEQEVAPRPISRLAWKALPMMSRRPAAKITWS